MSYVAQWSPETISRSEVDSLLGHTILEFGADWCPHCQGIQGVLRSELNKHPKFRHLKIEDGKGRRLGRSYGVKLWPNIVLLLNGKQQNQLARPSKEELAQALETFFAQ